MAAGEGEGESGVSQSVSTQQFYYRRLRLRNQPPLARSISAESSAGTGGTEGRRESAHSVSEGAARGNREKAARLLARSPGF